MDETLMNPEPREADSTLIRRGASATTFNELEQFVETIEGRPLDKLLTDLPGIAGFSGAKFDLARQVVRAARIISALWSAISCVSWPKKWPPARRKRSANGSAASSPEESLD